MLRLTLALWLAAAAPALAAPASDAPPMPAWAGWAIGLASLAVAAYAIKRFLDGFKKD